jgi:hypothetical protein
MNLPTSKQNHGYIGIRDFRGDLIRLHEEEGWIFHSEVCIWKDPVTAMQRTKALGLLWKQLKKDSCMSRQGIPDYLVTMRKPGENPERVAHSNEDFPVELWQNYASPVWMDINPSDTLAYREARENDDERPMREAVLALQEKLRNETCEGIATVRWVPFAITQDDQGKNKYERLNTLDPSFGKKYNRGASAFPKVEGAPATEWVEVFEGQEISVQVLPEISNFLPFKADE